MTTHRLLICGHPFHDVMLDLAAGLERRHWRVDLMPAPFSRPSDGGPVSRRLARVLPARSGMARAIRRADAELGDAAAASRWFADIEATLTRGAHDAVLAYLEQIPAGFARLVLRCHPSAVFVSLVALPQELRFRRALPLLRLAAHVAARTPLHPDLFRAVDASRIPLLVCPSRAWLDDAVAAGVTRDRGCVIPFGVTLPAPDNARAAQEDGTARLLWAGRLAPEKGLHLFLDALPLVAARRRVRLTVIGAPGSERYARGVSKLLDTRRDLAALVEMRGPMARADLRTAFGRHDLLLFHSVFREPVAQVLLMAAAARLPVVGPTSTEQGSLIREGETAWCYADTSPAAIAAAVLRALDNPMARSSRALALEDAVRRDHDVARTIDAYDRLLRARVGGVRRPEALSA